MYLGRDEATRTPDPYVPNVVRYQLRYIPNAVKRMQRYDVFLKQRNILAIIFSLYSFYCWMAERMLRVGGG